jgi:hypothetical protein
VVVVVSRMGIIRMIGQTGYESSAATGVLRWVVERQPSLYHPMRSISIGSRDSQTLDGGTEHDDCHHDRQENYCNSSLSLARNPRLVRIPMTTSR